MQFTFFTRKFGNVERNSHCDVLRITPVRVARRFLDCNGVFAIKAYSCVSRLVFNLSVFDRDDTAGRFDLYCLPMRSSHGDCRF